MKYVACFCLWLWIVSSACNGDSGEEARVTTPTTSLVAEATFGSIERLPGGTAVITTPHRFVSAVCENGVLTLTTTAATFSGVMDCAAQPPNHVLARFLDKEIAIVVGGGRLKIENPEAGSLDFPARDVRS